ncbi:uncharacterized protein [Euphorbia lathyris]|uniref:uncharacterized protein n=1 Tax=Euphorbia lathyris TaxID=212925 RepID=UPI0033132A15
MASMNRNYTQMGLNRSESLLGYTEHSSLMMEKRQLFLRSYQFCRKQSLTERMKKSLIRMKKVIWLKLRSARKIRKLVWSRLRFALNFRRRRRFLRLLNHHNHHCSDDSSYCFW